MPRDTAAAPETEDHVSVSNIDDKRVAKSKGAEASTVRINQESRAVSAAREPRSSPYISQGYADANISHDEWVRRHKIREMNKAAERAQRASRILQQVTASGPTGGYSPLARRLLLVSQRKAAASKGLTITHQGPKQTINIGLLYPDRRWTREGGNGAGLVQQRAEHNHTPRSSVNPDLAKSPGIADFTGKRPLVTFVGAGMPTSNPISAGPVQRKRKRYIEAYPTQEEPLGKRR
ncbi:hypothetical protein F4782DRAFT_545414 [Xylaria castorea]|nr:hypothetical protein F4782DRAFT_545414 [Xylaria castorea]